MTIPDIIYRPLFYLKHGFSETGFCPRLQVEPTQLGLTDRASLCLLTGSPKFCVLDRRQDDG
jgi:hypothetical protein